MLPSLMFFLWLSSLARIEYENFYMAQSSQKVMPPSSGFNISGPVARTFQHSKETTIAQPGGTPKLHPAGRSRPQIPVPDIPSQEGE